MKTNKYIVIFAALLILSLGLISCNNQNLPNEGVTEEETADVIEVTAESVDPLQEEDSRDEELNDYNNVIALSKSNAELWVLAGGQLTATSDDALEIENLNDDVISLGDMDHVSLEAITALQPDLLILFSTDPAQKALGEAAENIGINVVYTNIDGYDDYMEVMGEFTTLTGREDLYEENVIKVRQQVDQVIAKVPEDADNATYLLLHVSATKSKAEKNDYFASEIFNNLGLTNIAGDNSAFDELSMEAIVSADPDYIFVVPRGDEEKALASFDEIFKSDPSWESLSAVQNGNYYLLSKELFGLKPNARWGEAYEEAYKLLYGEK